MSRGGTMKRCRTCEAPPAAPRFELNRPRRRVQRKARKGGACSSCESQTAPAEREADRIAHWLAMGSQNVPAVVASPPASGPELARPSQQGAPLPSELRHSFETRLGADLSDVRLHDDGHAHRLAGQLGAEALTYGSDIYFRAGAFDPASLEGRKTIAHEVAHTVQQTGRAAGVQRQEGESSGITPGGAATASRAIHDELFPAGETLTGVLDLVGIVHETDEALILRLIRTVESANRPALRSMYFTLYHHSIERDLLARTSDTTFRRALVLFRPTYSLPDLVRVHLLRYPFPETGRLPGWQGLLPWIRTGRYFGDQVIVDAVDVATDADRRTLASDPEMLRELAGAMAPGPRYEVMKRLFPDRTAAAYQEAAADRIGAAGEEDVGAIIDVLLDMPHGIRWDFWNRYSARATGISYEDMSLIGRIATEASDAEAYDARLLVAVRESDAVGIEQAIDDLVATRAARQLALAEPDSAAREDRLAALGDVGARIRANEFGGLPESVRALVRAGDVEHAMRLAHELSLTEYDVATALLEQHSDDFALVITTLQSIRSMPTRRRVWDENRALVETHVEPEEETDTENAASVVGRVLFTPATLVRDLVRTVDDSLQHGLSRGELELLTSVGTGDSFGTALASLQRAVDDDDLRAIYGTVERMSEEDRERLRDESPPIWTQILSAPNWGPQFLRRTAESGVIPAMDVARFALQGRSANRPLLEVGLEAMPPDVRNELREAAYQAHEEHGLITAPRIEDYRELQRGIAHWFGGEDYADLMEQLLDVPDPQEIATPEGRLEAAAVMRRRVRVRAGLEGDAAAEAFTTSDENLAGAAIEFEALYQRAVADGAVSEAELQALLHFYETFRERYSDYTGALEEIGSIGATLAAVAVSLVFVAATGGAGTPTVAMLLAQMGASGALTAVTRAGTQRILQGHHFDSEDAMHEVASGFVEGALAPLTNMLASRIVGAMSARAIAEVTVEAAEAGVRGGVAATAELGSAAATRAASHTFGTTIAEGIVDGFLGGVLGEGTLRAADARAWRRGVIHWLAVNGGEILRAGAIGAFTGAVTTPVFHAAGRAMTTGSTSAHVDGEPPAHAGVEGEAPRGGRVEPENAPTQAAEVEPAALRPFEREAAPGRAEPLGEHAGAHSTAEVEHEAGPRADEAPSLDHREAQPREPGPTRDAGPVLRQGSALASDAVRLLPGRPPFRVGPISHILRVVNGIVVLCTFCGSLVRKIQLIRVIIASDSAAHSALHEVQRLATRADRQLALLPERRVVARALDETTALNLERSLQQAAEVDPELAGLLGMSLEDLNRYGEQIAAETGDPEAVTGARRRRARAIYAALAERERGYRTELSRDDFIQRYESGQVLERGHWLRLDTAEESARIFETSEPRVAQQELEETLGWRPYADLLEGELHVSRLEQRATLEEVGFQGQTHDRVRHALKERYRPELMQHLIGAAEGIEAQLRGEYPRLDWDGDPEQARRSALLQRFLRLTEALGPSDRGNLFEEFNRRVFLDGGTHLPREMHPWISREELLRLGIATDALRGRRPDRFEVLDPGRPAGPGAVEQPARVILEEDKNVRSALPPSVRQQMLESAELVDNEVHGEFRVGGRTARVVAVEGARFTFPQPEGVLLNRDFLLNDLLEIARTELVVHDWHGRRWTLPRDGDPEKFLDALASDRARVDWNWWI